MTRAVLTFHSVDDSGTVLSFPIRAFARLVERLAVSGVPVVEFDELQQRDHGVAITFDDGMRSVHRNALPVLQHHGFPAHLFLTTAPVGKQDRWPTTDDAPNSYEMLDWDDVEACHRGGISIEGHTATHPDLTRLSPTAIIDECVAADEEIERRIGRRPRLFAFPFGRFDDAVRQTLAPRYAGCFTTRLDYFRSGADTSCVPRLDTYYLQASWLHDNLLAASTQGYVCLRSWIRTIRGIT